MGNSLSSQSNASESAPVYSSDDKPPRPARKRRRLDPDASNSEPEVPELKSTPKSVPKRTRTGRSIPGDDEDVRNVTPVSMETEDISEEVDRRLRIKEERHRKKDAKPEKRKRESMASNESTHSSPRGVSVKPRSKKTKPNDFSDTMDKEEAVYLQGPGGIKKRDSDDTTKKSGPDVNVGAKCTKRRESDHSQSEEKRVSKRTKRETFSNA
ncbi:hypothetical protein PHISCL_05921 [Aspergillus sclerotialis]|uniref:Uncharacterized protein n=1 Tax=Aspergillus sclerotialis TaxID=2070753 RepID=A0A3A2ZK16_9EURO|nr:hypothetical protein PHISCL_05921 [Aspergillus sclerotialis]